VVASKILGSNPLGVALTAVVTFAITLALALIGTLVLTSRVGAMIAAAIGSATDSAGFTRPVYTGFGIHTIFGILAGSMFGANTTISATLAVASGSAATGGQELITLGFMPMGFTVLTLAVAVLVWRRETSRYTAAWTVVADAIRTAVVAALLMLILALVVTTNGSFSTTDGSGASIGASVKITTSAVGACLSTLWVVAVVLILAGLAGRNLFAADIAPFTRAVGAAVKGVAAFAVALAVMGLIAGIISGVWASHGIDNWFANNTDTPVSSLGTLSALAVAFGGNLGSLAGSLGAFGKVQITLEGQLLPHMSAGVSDMARASGAWWLLLLVPVVAVAAGAMTSVRRRQTRADTLAALAAFCALLLVAVPTLGGLANLRVPGFSMGLTGVWNNNFSITQILSALGLPYGMLANSFSLVAGANLVSATFLIFLVAMVVSFVAALAVGAVMPKRPTQPYPQYLPSPRTV